MQFEIILFIWLDLKGLFQSQHAGITGARLDYLKCNNKFNRFSKPWVEKGIDDRVETGIKIKQT